MRRAALALLLVASPAAAQAGNTAEAIQAAQRGGTVIVCRHAITNSFREREPVDYDDPSTQRQLNTALGISIDDVVASPMHRARRTAELMFDRVPRIDPIWHTNGGSYGGDARAARAGFLSQEVASGNVLVVSHIGTMESVLPEARGEVGEGDCLVVQPERGGYSVLGIVPWEEWGRSGGGDPRPAEGRSQESRTNPLHGPGSATHPAVSPDGRSVAFMSNMEGVRAGVGVNFEIYLSTTTGTDVMRLTDNEVFDADVAWAPEGGRIAYKSYVSGNDDIFVMDRSGGGRRNLTSHPSSDFQPHWSSDGSRIVFGSDRGGTAGLFVLDVEDGGVEVLLDTPASESSPRWSPDGTRLVFVSDRDGTDDLYIANSDGSDVTLLVSSPDSDWSPRWSPDGATILYISGDFSEDRWTLYSVSPARPGHRTELVVGVDSGNPSWHPSGESFYFGRYVDGESRLFIARADGSDVRPVAAR